MQNGFSTLRKVLRAVVTRENLFSPKRYYLVCRLFRSLPRSEISSKIKKERKKKRYEEEFCGREREQQTHSHLHDDSRRIREVKMGFHRLGAARCAMGKMLIAYISY